MWVSGMSEASAANPDDRLSGAKEGGAATALLAAETRRTSDAATDEREDAFGRRFNISFAISYV